MRHRNMPIAFFLLLCRSKTEKGCTMSEIPVTEEVTTDQTPDQTPEPITPESLNEMVLNRDTEGLAKATEALEQSVQPAEQSFAPPTPAPDQQDVSDPTPDTKVDPQADAQSAEPTAKFFKTNFRGEEVSVPDDDTYLGQKSFGHLKKGFVHAQQDVKLHREEAQKSRVVAEHAVRARVALEAQVKELKGRLGNAQPAAPTTPTPQPASSTPPPVPQPAPVAPLVAPEAPDYPDLPSNTIDWSEEHHREFKEYHNKLKAHQGSMVSYVDQRVERAVQPTTGQLAPEVQADIDAIKAENAKFKERFDKQDQSVAAQEQEIETSNYWNSVEAIRRKHPSEFGDPESAPIQTLHKSVVDWTHNLAAALGAQKPYVAYNPQNNEWKEYDRARSTIVNAYRKNDPEILKKAEGVNPPSGWEQYYQTSDLIAYRGQLVSEGILGEKASLQDAWVHKFEKDGNFEKGIESVQRETQESTASNIIEVMTDQQANSAHTISNDHAGAQANTGLSVEQEKALLATPPQELMNDPAKYSLHQQVVAKYGQAMDAAK